jgi:catechol 2,3-dioxygenase-like lactoylglutathione lyase family enzyme
MTVRELFAYLRVPDAARAIEFYTTAFGARETMRLTKPSGRIGHAELDFGGPPPDHRAPDRGCLTRGDAAAVQRDAPALTDSPVT